MRKLVIGVLAAGACLTMMPRQASARPPYQQAFWTNYNVKQDSKLGMAKCQLCHMGDNKAVRNPYGAALAKALGKEKATPEEVTAALKKVENEVSADKKTKYIDLIKADKLPGAPAEAK